eukprot:7505214-Pyramimonas_sp.AAC.1
MANRMPRNEAQSDIGGQLLEHKRPRTNARYLSPLSQLTVEWKSSRGDGEGHPERAAASLTTDPPCFGRCRKWGGNFRPTLAARTRG